MTDPTLLISCNAFFNDESKIASKLKDMLIERDESKGTDQARVTELRAAIDMIHSCLISTSGAGSPARLEKAETLCHQEIQRPPNSMLARGLHGRARFSLAVINHLREEHEVCAASVAHSFLIAPLWSRRTFPEIFDSVFKPLCLPLYEQLAQEETQASEKSYIISIVGQRTAAVVVGAGVGGAMGLAAAGLMIVTGGKDGWTSGATPAFSRIITGAVKGSAGAIWNNATRDNAREARLVEVRGAHERRLDERCQSIARNLL